MPSLGMITLNALAAADSVVITVQAQYLPAKGMTQLLQTISKVEKVENGRVYTVEGNSGDSCRENSYPLGYYEILGYGVPAY